MKYWFLVLACCAPASLFAQSATALSTYMGAVAGVEGSPAVVGLTLSRETPWLGVRVGGAVDARLTPLAGGDSDAPAASHLWGADVDALLLPGDLADHLAFTPYAVLGVGVRGLTNDLDTPATLDWSYGAGARSQLVGPLHVEAELRYRQPLEKPAEPSYSKIGSGLELRAGITVRIGGRSAPVARRVSVPSVPRRTPTGATPAAGTSRDAAAAVRYAVAMRALDTADDYIGVPYVWGGNTPGEGFDCSGFIKFVFARQGIALPRVSRDQARSGMPLPLDLSAFEPGDLLAFASRGTTVDHIAIYAGDGRIIHASSSGQGVRIDNLHTRRGQWYLDHMVSARRVIETPLHVAVQ